MSGLTHSQVATLKPTSSVNFGNQLANTTSAAQTVRLTNTGTAPLAVTSITPPSIPLADPEGTGACPSTSFSLAAGTYCTSIATYGPTSTGNFTGAISIADNALLGVVCCKRLAAQGPSSTKVDTQVSATKTKLQVAGDYGKLPLSFEANEGQTDAKVKFLSRGTGQTLFLTTNGAVLTFSGRHALQLNLVGANLNGRINGLDRLPGYSNYFLGNDPSKWRTNVPAYGKVRYSQIYPGIALVYYGNQRQLENDFVVAPGADPAQIRLAIGGASKLSLDAEGNAVVGWKDGDVRLLKPRLYQEVRGEKIKIAGGYALKGNELRFIVGQYDHRQRLVIDPVLVYSTYLGGSGIDYAKGIAVDSSGSAYVAGYTSSTNFPLSTAPEQGTFGGGLNNVFVAKLTPAGDALVYSTYIGGSVDDGANGLAVDSSGNAYVVGYTQSTNFPGASSSSIQATYGGGSGDGFVLELNATGNALVYSSYLGGAGSDVATAIALDSSGNAYVVGETQSANFPGVTSSSMQAANAGGGDAFVTKINPGGTAIVYSTYLGGAGSDTAYAVAVDSSGNAFVVGQTSSTSFPGVNSNSLQPASGGGTSDGFVAELNAAGTALVYSTFLGGNGTDLALGIALDSTGNAYVTGYTASTNFPVTPGAFQAASGGGYDGFVAKLNPGGTTLVYSTYLGGSGTDEAAGIAVDSSGNAYVAGGTTSTNFPGVNSSSVQSVYGGGASDAVVAELNPAGSALVFSTYLGGSGADVAVGIGLDSTNNVYIAGYTGSTNFPLGAQPVQSTYGGGTYDAFIAKLAAGPATTTTVAASPAPSVLGQQVTFTVNVRPSSSSSLTPSGNVTISDGSTPLGTVALTSGTATFSTSGLSVGSHNITAAYAGDNNFAASTSATLALTVNPVTGNSPTTTTLASSAGQTVFGQAVTLSATVAGAGSSPTGTVSFSDSGLHALGSAPLSNGQANLTISSLGVGPHSFAASYGGDATFAPSMSAAVSGTVNEAATTVALTSSSGSVSFAQSVTLTASLSVVSPGAGTPTGSISFNDGASPLATVPLGNSGTVTFSTSTLTSGVHAISAVYQGDSDFQSSISAALIETVSWPAPYLGGPLVLGISVGTGPLAMALNPANERIYVANQGSNNVSVIDATTNQVTTIPVGKAPSAVAINSQTNTIYVADRDSGDVAVINGASNTVSYVAVPLTGAPDSIAVEPGTGNVFVGTGGPGVLAVINATTQQVVYPDPTALFGPIAVASSPLSGRMYVADVQDSDLEIYEGATTFLLNSVSMASPQALAINPPTLYVADGAGNLYVVDETGTNSPLPLSAGLNPHAIAANPADNTIYLADQSPAAGQAATVTQFNASNNAVLGTYIVGPSAVPARTPAPNKIAIDSAANLVYVANEGSNTVSILDGGVGNVLTTVPTGITPTAVLVDPLKCAAYVSNFGSGTVSVIQQSVNGPAVCLSTSSLVFGRVPVGSNSASQTVVLTNIGTSTLLISGIASTGGFLETDGCPTRQIPPGGYCLIQEAFAATIQGIARGLLTITDNAAGSPQVVALTGAAVAPSTTQVTTNSPVVYGQAISMSAQVTASQGTPTGTVTFFEDGQTVLAIVKLGANGSASFATASPFFLPVGSQHTITAVYNGDLNFDASTSPASVIVVNKDATFLSQATELHTQPLQIQVTVDALSPGGGVPTGVVVFLDGQNAFASAILDATGTGTAPMVLSPGSHSISVSYQGDSNFNPSTSTQPLIVVIPIPTVTTVTASPTAHVSTLGTPVTLTVTVNTAASTGGNLSGIVTLMDGPNWFGSLGLIGSSTSGSVTTPALTFPIGQHSITAAYQDTTGNFIGSVSLPFLLTVTQSGTVGGPGSCACSLTGAYVTPSAPVAPVAATTSPHQIYTVIPGSNSFTVQRNSDTQNLLTVNYATLPNFGFSPDDDRFVVNSVAGGIDSVTVYDLTSVSPSNLNARPIVTTQSHANLISDAISFSPSGRYFLYEDTYGNGNSSSADIQIYQVQSTASQLLIYDSGAFPFVSAPGSGNDSFGVLSQGFSPDKPETSFVYAYVAGPNVGGQIPTQWDLVSLVNPQRVLASGTYTDVADAWEFSPCGDFLAAIRQLQSQATGANNVAEVDLRSSATGAILNPGGYMATSINSLLLNCTPTGQAITDLTQSPAVTTTVVTNVSCSNTPVTTPTGTATVVPADSAGSGLAPVTVTFTGVSQAGTTTLTISTASGQALPPNTQPGTPSLVFDLTTTAAFTTAQVCISYSGISFTGSNLILLHSGVQIPTTIDTVHQMICGMVTSFSPFIVAEQSSSPTVSSISAPSVVYGTAASVTVSVNSSTGIATGAVTLSVDSGAATSSTLTNGSAVFNLGLLNAGTHSLSANFAAQGSFTGSSGNGTLVVTQTPLTITANNATKVYGASLPAFTAGYTGFVNGDTAASLGGTLSFATPATAASPVGSYAITPSGVTSANYTINYANGTLNVTPASLTVTANSVSKVYGVAVPTLGFSASGFVNGDNAASLTTQPMLSTTAMAASGVGNYPISISGAMDPNYSIAYVQGILTVTPAALTVTAANAQRVYGAANPVLTGTITGIQKGDNITATYTTVATPTSLVGTYAIVPTLVDPGGKGGNYIVTLVNGVLTVLQASTTTALSASPDPSNFGQSVTLAATVAPVVPGAGTATGKVTFFDGSTTLGTSTLSSTDTATLTTSSLAAGSHSFTASYGGDANFSASSSTALADQVLCGVLISLSPSTVPLGGTVTVTGKVISCSTTTQTVVVQFALSGPSQPNSCSNTKSMMFTTPPFPLAPKTSRTVSFPFKVPSRGVCPGTYSITAATLVNGVAEDTSTASLAITAH
jgi:YVTN family beta-propeller protein